MSYLAHKKTGELVNSLILLVPGILCSLYVASKVEKKAKSWYKAWKEKKVQREIQQRLEGINFEGYECIICMERGRNVIFLPCKHFCLCEECLEELQRQECPVCKREICETVKLFLS